MILSSTDTVEGKRVVQTLGLAHGAVARASGIRLGLIAFIKNLIGGELEEVTQILAQAREHALDRMREHARSMGANGVVCVRFTSAEVASYAAEIIVYGTAVVLEDDEESTAG